MSELAIARADKMWVNELNARGFRAVDNAECMASSGRNAYESSLLGIEISTKSWVAFHKSIPFCVFGYKVVNEFTGLAIPWMLATDDIKKAEFQLVKYGKSYIDLMFLDCQRLENFVHAKNEVAIDWLAFCGFNFDDAKPFGVAGELFHKFYMNRGQYV